MRGERKNLQGECVYPLKYPEESKQKQRRSKEKGREMDLSDGDKTERNSGRATRLKEKSGRERFLSLTRKNWERHPQRKRDKGRKSEGQRVGRRNSSMCGRKREGGREPLKSRKCRWLPERR